MKKAIIFDLDGTLVNSLPDIAASMNRSLTKFGLPTWQTEEYKAKVGNGVFKIVERSVGSRQDLAQKVCDEYMKDYAENCAVNSFAYKGLNELLLRFHDLGIRMAVLSNKDQHDVEKVLRFCYPDIRFDIERGRVEGVGLKPDPAGARLIASEWNIAPSDIWFVGDSTMDVFCGKGAGMETIGVLWGFREKEDLVGSGADYLAEDAEELGKIIVRE